MMKKANPLVEDLRVQASKIGIPDFSLLKLDRIAKMSLAFPRSGIGILLTVATRYPIKGKDISIVLGFDGVRDLQFPVLSGNVFSFGELVVEDVRERQLEGIRFWVNDYLVDISFYCNTIEISLPTAVDRLDAPESYFDEG